MERSIASTGRWCQRIENEMTGLDALLRQCTVRLSVAGVKGHGTGFFVAPGLVVTCAHVVKGGNTKAIDVVWRDQSYCAEPYRLVGDPRIDLALLKLTDPPPHPCVYLLDDAQTGDQLYSFGYPDDYLEGDSARAEYEGPTGGPSPLLKFKETQIRPGFSGAPLLNERTGRVCGVVRRSRDRSSALGGRGVPAAAIFAQFSELAALQQTFHQLDKRWMECAAAKGELIGSVQKLPARVVHSLHRAMYFKGRKSKLNDLSRFWSKGGGGVFCLIGIGGCGKTAIVQEFLENQGWLDSLADPIRPDGIFIWSFYDPNSSTAAFFDEAYRYFSQWQKENGAVKQQRANEFSLAEQLETADRSFLIVLDGLERTQSEGGLDGLPRGKLFDSSLRNFLRKTADGQCGRSKVIVTSRFPLTDLTKWSGYVEKDVTLLEIPAARSLLRDLHVRVSSTKEMDALIVVYGRHALTLDLLGRYLAEYYKGDIAITTTLIPLEEAIGSTEIEEQAYKLGRVLRAYETALTAPELATLERLSIFRQPVYLEFLKDVFLGKKNALPGNPLAGIKAQEFRSILGRLAERRLVIVEKAPDDKELFTSHPAVKDYFYHRLGNPQGLHAAVQPHLNILMRAPGYIRPRDPKAIDLIDEAIYQTVRAGRINEAYETYKERLGYIHLGWKLGDQARGAMIVKLFGNAIDGDRGDLTDANWERLMIDYGLYLKNLGRLDEAGHIFSRVAKEETARHANVENLALGFQNLSAVQVLRGFLRDAEVSAHEAVKYATESRDERLTEDCQVRLATAFALQGRTNEAISIFNTVKPLLAGERRKALPRDLSGLRLGWLLMRLGRFSEAESLLQKTRELSAQFDFGIIAARADIIVAELAYRQGNMDSAWQARDRVLVWLKESFDQEMSVARYLISAWLALAERDTGRANNFVRYGLGEAEEWGYGIYWIDLKIAQGRISLALGDHLAAARFADLALNKQSSRGQMVLGARSNECGYLWGQVDALELLADSTGLRGNREKANKLKVDAEGIRSYLNGSSSSDLELAAG